MGNQQENNIKDFKQIPFAKDFLVSKDGQVFSVLRNKMVKTSVVTGYYRVWLKDNEGNKAQHLVHRIVAITFIPNQHQKEQVNHKDGNKQNNHVNNLEWVSRQENMRHAFDTGLNSNLGSRNGKAVLNESQVLEIYQLCLDGKSNVEIAALYDVNKNMVNLIRGRYSWAHITKDLPDAPKQHRSERLTAEQITQLVDLRAYGFSARESSEMLGVTLNQAESVTRSRNIASPTTIP
jgi:transposase